MVKRQLKQKQKQSQSVNIYLGSRGKAKGKRKARGKSKGRESKTQYIPPFNPAPMINFPAGYSQPIFPSNLTNLPPPQRAAFPESQTAAALNVSATTPVPFAFQGAETKLKAKPKEEKLVAPEETKAEEEVVLPVDLPEEPAEEELSVSSTLTAPTVGSPTFENLLARNAVEGLNPPYVASSLGVPLSLTSSGFFPVASSTPFFPVEATAEPKEEPRKEKKQQKKTSTSSAGSGFGAPGSIHTFFPPITPANPLSVTTGLPVDFLPPLFSIPISTEKIPRTFTLGQPNPYTFLGAPTAPPEKAKGEFLQRQRGTALPPAEESLLLSP